MRIINKVGVGPWTGVLKEDVPKGSFNRAQMRACNSITSLNFSGSVSMGLRVRGLLLRRVEMSH